MSTGEVTTGKPQFDENAVIAAAVGAFGATATEWRVSSEADVDAMARGDHGIAELTPAGLFAMMGAFDLFGTVASGWLSDKYDNRH
jgi:ammonia channel protein AmtB